MNIQQYQYIIAVVDLKNFEAAAERCFISQSTLSTMIGRFEEEIGIKIFNRKTKPVSVTPDGEKVINRLRIILNEIDALKNVIQELKGEMVGELKIGIIPTIAPYLLPLFLEKFAERFPKVNFLIKEMNTASIQKSLRNRTIDVGILAIPLDDLELDEIALYTEPFLVYDCTKEKGTAKVSIKNLDYSKLCLLQEGHCLRTQVKQICELSNHFKQDSVNYEFESGSMESLLRITKARQGITVIPHLATIDFLYGETEKLIEFESPKPVRQVGMVTNKFFVKKRLLDELKEIIQESVHELIPESENQQVFNPI